MPETNHGACLDREYSGVYIKIAGCTFRLRSVATGMLARWTIRVSRHGLKRVFSLLLWLQYFP
ncbi:hypothetical protein KCP75_01300 [Salmonella enterica subsp. enterica]|nr:hypothetical protein KCP75_01300 [Salmonella enterica subsp. enterica]